MRLQVTPALSTKDGLSNKNARLTNCLKEIKKNGEKAVIRPGLVLSDTYTGLGNGLVPFYGRLLAIYGDVIYDAGGEIDLDVLEWNAYTFYQFGDGVFYLGQWWGATDVSQGETPFLNSSHWRSIIEIYDYVPSETYTYSQAVREGDTVYYAITATTTGNLPSTSPSQWSTTRPTPTYSIANVVKTPTNITLGQTQTCTFDIQISGSTVASGGGTYATALDGSIASASASNWPTTSAGGTLGHSIAVYQAKPTAPPDTLFSGSTYWSGDPGYDNFAWSPIQSGGSWSTVG